MEHFVIGMSEDVEAEYGQRADAPVTLLSICEGEIYCVEGFKTISGAKDQLLAECIEMPSYEIL